MRPLGGGDLVLARVPHTELRTFRDFGCRTWAQVLLKWALSDRRVTAVIPATSDERHLHENADAGRLPWFGVAERDRVVALAKRYCL